MIGFDICAFCKHRRDKMKDGWIDTCDAFPDGVPLDFDYSKVKKIKECNNGIGYEPIEGESE